MLRPSVVQVQEYLLNASEDGMKLLVAQALAPGTVIQVRFQKRSVLTEVRCSLPHADKFAVGVEVTAAFDLPLSEPQS